MMRLRKIENNHVSFQCPGCGDHHTVPVTTTSGIGWQWNGDVNLPTLSPSILVRSGHYADHWEPGDGCWCGKDYGFECYRCHSFVRDGRIEFLGDCTHPLAGHTVDLPEIVDET